MLNMAQHGTGAYILVMLAEVRSLSAFLVKYCVGEGGRTKA